MKCKISNRKKFVHNYHICNLIFVTVDEQLVLICKTIKKLVNQLILKGGR